MSLQLHPVASLSVAMSTLTSMSRLLREIRILDADSINSSELIARNKVASICDVVSKQYYSLCAYVP